MRLTIWIMSCRTLLIQDSSRVKNPCCSGMMVNLHWYPRFCWLVVVMCRKHRQDRFQIESTFHWLASHDAGIQLIRCSHNLAKISKSCWHQLVVYSKGKYHFLEFYRRWQNTKKRDFNDLISWLLQTHGSETLLRLFKAFFMWQYYTHQSQPCSFGFGL